MTKNIIPPNCQTASTLLAATIALTVVPLHAQPPDDPPAEPPTQSPNGQVPPKAALQEKLNELRQNHKKINNQLTEISSEAQEEEPVAKALKRFQKAVFERMVQQAPQLEEEVREYAELTRAIQQSDQLQKEPDERKKPFAKKWEKYQNLRKELLPVEREAFRDESVRELQSEYQDTLIARMKEIDSDAERLLERRQEITMQLRQIQKTLMQQQNRPQSRQPESP